MSFLKNTKKLAWIYWEKFLVQALTTLFSCINKILLFIGLVVYNSWNEEKVREMGSKQNLLFVKIYNIL